jgi:hypothetical protein
MQAESKNAARVKRFVQIDGLEDTRARTGERACIPSQKPA